MKRVILLFVSLAVMAFQLLFAQSFTVKGKVIAEEGNEPLIGVAIMQEGTNNGVITDIDGNYSIEIKGVAQATLVYSYIGMQQQQHVVTPQTHKLDITLSAGPDSAFSFSFSSASPFSSFPQKNGTTIVQSSVS